jgi:hypothetical protein
MTTAAIRPATPVTALPAALFRKSSRQSMIPKSGSRFPACAKPWYPLAVWLDASVGEGRSERSCSNQKARD